MQRLSLDLVEERAGNLSDLSVQRPTHAWVLPTAEAMTITIGRYRKPGPIPLNAMEHTAQWTTTKAAEIQQDIHRQADQRAFVLDRRSSSGSTLASSNPFVLRNVPPSGVELRAESGPCGTARRQCALVLTYAQRRSHDLTAFGNPRE